MHYAIPSIIREKSQAAQKSLKEYDDGEAERLIKDALKRL